MMIIFGKSVRCGRFKFFSGNVHKLDSAAQ